MQGGKRGIRQDSERALHHVRPGMQCLPLPYAHPRLSGSGVFFRLAIGGDAIPSVGWEGREKGAGLGAADGSGASRLRGHSLPLMIARAHRLDGLEQYSEKAPTYL